MPKFGINPVTIRPLPSHPGLNLSLARTYVGPADGEMSKMITAVMWKDGEPLPADKSLVPSAVLDEDLFIGALGHLFPKGELMGAHKDTEDRKSAIPWQPDPFEMVFGLDGKPLDAKSRLSCINVSTTIWVEARHRPFKISDELMNQIRTKLQLMIGEIAGHGFAVQYTTSSFADLVQRLPGVLAWLNATVEKFDPAGSPES